MNAPAPPPGHAARIPAAAITAAAPAVHKLMCLFCSGPALRAEPPCHRQPNEVDQAAARMILEAAEPHLAQARVQAAIDTLRIGQYDALLVRAAGPLTQEQAQQLSDRVTEALGGRDVPLLVTDDGTQISAVRDVTLAAAIAELAAARQRITELETADNGDAVGFALARISDLERDAAEADEAIAVREHRVGELTDRVGELEQLADAMLDSYTQTSDGWRARVSGTIRDRWAATRAGQQ